MKLIIKVGYWALVLYDLYLFGMLLTDPTMVYVKKYGGIAPILRHCHSTPPISSAVEPTFADPETCPYSPIAFLGSIHESNFSSQDCYHTQFAAFDLVTNQYRCIVSAKFEAATFEQVLQILSNPSYIFASEHIRGSDSCHWSLNRQRFLVYHIAFLVIILVSIGLNRLYEWCAAKLVPIGPSPAASM